MVPRISSARESRRVRSANSTSSSEKSSSSSISEASSVSLARMDSREAENAPLVWERAMSWAAREEAAIRSAIPSAWARSIRPLRKALRVNSPGSAVRAPARMTACRISRWMNSEPWQEISTVSSPVNDFGARKSVATHSSIWRPSESAMVPKWAVWVCASFRPFPFHI